MSNGIPATGWIRDLPDWRDVMVGSKKANDVQGQYDSFTSFRATTFPTSADLRQWCTPVEDQMNLGSCTSQAVAGGVELLQRKFFGNYIDASRLFLYKTTRSLMGWTGDRGAQIRQTMKALAMFGVPPEKFWPYDIAKYEDEPTAFVYSMAQSYKAVNYFRIDPSIPSPIEEIQKVLPKVKQQLASGFPVVFGFIVFGSCPMPGTQSNGDIPMPKQGDMPLGGHAVLAVGFDDNRIMPKVGGGTTTGALLIRNSWGTVWGDQGYGWLPFEFVNTGLAMDFWAMTYVNYLDFAKFDTKR